MIQGLCLNPVHKEPKKTKARGLCANCYKTARLAVRTGKVTWEELEAAGRCLQERMGWFNLHPDEPKTAPVIKENRNSKIKEQIIECIAMSEWVKSDAIHAYIPSLSIRQLQRYLSQLFEEGKIERRGRSYSIEYQLAGDA